MNSKDKRLDYSNGTVKKTIDLVISGSKSESNRLLILQQLYPNLSLKNTSDSDDTVHLKAALACKEPIIDIGHAGTAMRFLTAYFAFTEGREVVLTGSQRMQNRPIGILVRALQELGADIQYEEKEGYPPLRIRGKKNQKDQVELAGNVSSQFLSALLLIAPSLPRGLHLSLTEDITSRPYLEMTLSLLNTLGISTQFKDQMIRVEPKQTITASSITIESDWSSASYFYSMAALSPINTTYHLSYYRDNSLQGDRCLAEIYEKLGVDTRFVDGRITLTKSARKPMLGELDLKDAPDIAQTIAVTCFGLQIPCNLTGLHTLKIKETDRLVALQNELGKLGGIVHITDRSLRLESATTIHKNCSIKTYDDHRMAMAFAPLAIKVPIIIEDAEVVSKSYVNFWKDLEGCFL